jgi:hypothetical protein
VYLSAYQAELSLIITAALDIQSPWTFHLRNPRNPNVNQTHAGVLEFIAEEGIVHLPAWVSRVTPHCSSVPSLPGHRAITRSREGCAVCRVPCVVCGVRCAVCGVFCARIVELQLIFADDEDAGPQRRRSCPSHRSVPSKRQTRQDPGAVDRFPRGVRSQGSVRVYPLPTPY